jgi:hypothetical protein
MGRRFCVSYRDGQTVTPEPNPVCLFYMAHNLRMDFTLLNGRKVIKGRIIFPDM